MSDRIDLGAIDVYVDVTYGVLLLTGIASIIILNDNLAATTFGVGVILGWMVHVGWRMARYDPEAVSNVEQAVSDAVSEHKSDIEETVEETVENEVGKNVAEQVGQAQSEMEERLEERVEEMEESVEETVEDVVDGQ